MKILLIFAIIAFVLFLFLKFRFLPKRSHLVLTTGELKSGKSMLSVYMAYRDYRKNLFIYKLKKFFLPFKYKKLEMPLLYSNVPLSIPYVPVTDEILTRQHRINYGSIVYLCETSLVANSQTYKDDLLNEQLLLFYKLFCHETHNGRIYLDTQNVSDNHYSVKRCLNTYLHIYDNINIRFICPWCFVKVRTENYSEDGSIINVNNLSDQINQTYDWVIVPKRVWRFYDRFAYSSFTDDLPVENGVVEYKRIKGESKRHFKKRVFKKLKVKKIPSFIHFKTINKEVK